MDREELLDGELTEERKNWLKGLVDALGQKSASSLGEGDFFSKILAKCALRGDVAAIEEVLSTIYPRDYEDDEIFCDVVIFVAAVGSEKGSSSCSLFLGDSLAFGWFGLREQLDRGSWYWSRAMDQGSPKGALKFANYYEYFHTVGEGELVLYYCIQAVLIGESAEAFYRIGDFYYEGRVVERDAIMAETLYQRSYDIAKTKGFDLVLARAALRLAEAKRERLVSQPFSLSEQEEVLAYYTEAEPIFSSYVAESFPRLESDLERCRKGIKEIKEIIAQLENEKPSRLTT